MKVTALNIFHDCQYYCGFFELINFLIKPLLPVVHVNKHTTTFVLEKLITKRCLWYEIALEIVDIQQTIYNRYGLTNTYRQHNWSINSRLIYKHDLTVLEVIHIKRHNNFSYTRLVTSFSKSCSCTMKWHSRYRLIRSKTLQFSLHGWYRNQWNVYKYG